MTINITVDQVLAPTKCQECAGFDTERPATCVANYQPSRLGGPVGESVYLCDSCASNTWIYCNRKPLAKVPAHMVTEEAPEALHQEAPSVEAAQDSIEEAPKAIAQQPAPSKPYVAWFQALLDQNLPLTSVESFEDSAYRGHVSYELGGTDGYYAPEDKTTWLNGFRQSPTSALYWGNDRRTELAPYVNSYWALLND